MTKDDKLNIQYQVKSNLATYKEIDNQSRVVRLVANTYNYYDSDNDVLIPGVAKRTINNRGAKSDAVDKILHAKDHDTRVLVGKSQLEAETTINGMHVLYAESKISETQAGEDLLIQYNEGIYNQHSIGFIYKDLERVERDTAEWDKMLAKILNPDEAIKWGFMYIVKEINLFEYSTVAFGANKLTPFLGSKSENKAIQFMNLQTKLDTLIKSDPKDKHLFDLEYRQLKQLMFEVYNSDPINKDTLVKDPPPVDHSKKDEELKKQFYINILNRK